MLIDFRRRPHQHDDVHELQAGRFDNARHVDSPRSHAVLYYPQVLRGRLDVLPLRFVLSGVASAREVAGGGKRTQKWGTSKHANTHTSDRSHR